MNRGLRAGGWWALITTTCVALAVLSTTLWLRGSDAGLGRLASVATVSGAVLTLVAVVVAIVSAYLAWRAISPPVPLERACEELGLAVAAEWRAEAVARGLANPQPIPVRWSSTRLPISATASEILNVPAEPGGLFEMQGDFTTVAERFQRLPARQLVIIGRPGAGKTSLAVVLVRDLLAKRKPGEPVPVLLTASEWSLSAAFDAWLVRRLQEQYPLLTNARRYGAQVAERLVKAGHILPVLDGLDEIRLPRSPQEQERTDDGRDEPAQPEVIDLLNSAVGDDRPVVATCRRTEFELLIERTGRPLLRAAVVEIEPVTVEQATQYLPAGQINGARRWAAVLRQITANPRGATAVALSTPLYVFLARTAYTKADPNNLITFSDPVDLKNHLLGEYLPATYAPTGTKNAQKSLPRYSPHQARRWLGFIAIYTQRGDGGCFDAFLDNFMKFDVRFAFGTPELMFGLVTTILFGRTEGAGVGVLVGLVYLLLAEYLTRRALVLGVAGRIVFAGILALAAGLWVDHIAPTAPWETIGVAVGGAYVAVATLFSIPKLRSGLDDWQSVRRSWKAAGRWPEGNLRSDPLRFAEWLEQLMRIRSRVTAKAAVFLVGLLIGVWAAAIFRVAELLTAGFTYLVLTELIYLLVAESLYRTANNILFGIEAKWLRSGVRKPRLRVAVSAVTTWFMGFGIGFGLIGGVIAGATVGIAGWLWFGPASRQLRQAVARVWLAMHGMLPWRLKRFLDDAYRRGVLRRAGGRLEFRHREIEKYLATYSVWMKLKID